MKMRRVLSGLIVGCSVLAAPASGQQEMNIRAHGVRPYTAEVKPVTTALSAIPGVGGVGAGAEAFVSPRVAAFVEGSYLDVNLPGSPIGARKLGEVDPFPVDTYGYNVALGARWYSSPESNSWYGGLGLAYARTDGEWESADERVDVSTAALLPSLAAGFRILWRNNLIMRIGGGLAANVVQSKTVDAKETTAAAEDAEKDVKDSLDQNLMANVDFGVGYSW